MPDTALAATEATPWRQHFDMLDPDMGARVFEIMADLRTRCPVAHSDRHGGFWMLTKYVDVRNALQDWTTFSSAHGVVIPDQPGRDNLPPLELDPPAQRVWRQIVSPFFTPAAIAPFEPRLRELVVSLIDAFIDDRRCDIVSQLAVPFPAMAFLELVLGVPRRELPRLQELTRAISGGGPDSSAANADLTAWVKVFLQDRAARPPRGDVVDALLAARPGGEALPRPAVAAAVNLLISGGLDTTTYAIGNLTRRLAEDPSLQTRLRARPALIPAAVEEFLRIDAPSMFLARQVTRDVVVRGASLRRGDRVALYWGSANRDAEVFERPDDVVIDRDRNHHLSFGLGVHFCLGAHLARLELRIVVEELVRRLRELRLLDPAAVTYKSTFTTRGPTSLPVSFTPTDPRTSP